MAEACGAGGGLDRWLTPFLDALGHKKRRTWAPLHLRGLLGRRSTCAACSAPASARACSRWRPGSA